MTKIMTMLSGWLQGKDTKHTRHMLKWAQEKRRFHAEQLKFYTKAERLYIKKLKEG